MFERFTDKGRVVLVRAKEIGVDLNSPAWRRHHMLLALIDGATENPEDNLAAVFDNAGVGLAAFRAKVLESLQGSETPVPEGAARLNFSSGAKKALELSLREALSLGHNYIASSHLLLAILRSADGPLADVIGTTELKYGTAREFVRQQSPEVRGGRGRGRRREARMSRRGRGTDGFEAVIRRAHQRASTERPITTGDLLVALAEVPGTHFASLVSGATLPDPTALALEADRLVSSSQEDGAVDAIRVDPRSGSVTVTDPDLAQTLTDLLGSADRDKLGEVLRRLRDE